MTSHVPSYILAGGKSSRFGSDKALAMLANVPLVVHVAKILRSVCEDVHVVADTKGKYADLDLPTIGDRRPGRGPIAGVEAALCDRLERFGPGWIVLVSCDMAGLKREWVEAIAHHAAWKSHGGRGCERRRLGAIAFRETFWQPFPAAYHSDLLPVVDELLDGDQASFQQLLSDRRTNADALPLPADWPAAVQANTPEELDRFRA